MRPLPLISLRTHHGFRGQLGFETPEGRGDTVGKGGVRGGGGGHASGENTVMAAFPGGNVEPRTG